MPRTKKTTTPSNTSKTIPTVLAAEQPYKVPENWRWVYLPAVCEYMRSGGDKPQDISVSQMNNHSIPVVANGMQDDGIIGYTNVKNEKAGTLTVSARGTIGHAIVRNYPYYPVIRLIVLSPNSFTISSYLKYIFDYFEEEGTGTSIPQLTVPSLKNKIIPLPPLAEQQRIVDRIESLFAKLDEAREKAQAVVDGFENRKAAILHKAFTGELTRKWREENLRGIINWNLSAIGDLTEIVSSKRIYKEEYIEDGVPFYRSSEVVELHDTGYTKPSYYISRHRYEEIKSIYGVPQKGDLLVTSVGTIGKTWIVDDREFYYKDGNLTQVKKCNTLNMRFLQLFIMSNEFKTQVHDSVAGTAYNALTIIKFKNIKLMLPNIEEQNQIVSIIDNLFGQEQRARDLAESVIAQINGMKKAILARAFRGELGTNVPSEAACEV